MYKTHGWRTHHTPKPASDNPQQEGNYCTVSKQHQSESNLLTATPALILHISGCQKTLVIQREAKEQPERTKANTRAVWDLVR